MAVVFTAACRAIAPDFDRIIALQIDGPLLREVLVGDTLVLAATAFNARGDEVPDAEIVWARLDLDSTLVTFTLEETTGTVVGVNPGQGRVQARVETLRSESVSITVLAPPDTTAGAPAPLSLHGARP